MKWRHAAIFAALLGTSAGLGARPALAAARVCAPMVVEADADLRARWPLLVQRVREALGSRDDVDACARIMLAARSAAIAVQVVLPDGRSAARTVSRSEDVVPMLGALLLVPQRSVEAAGPADAPTPRVGQPAAERPVDLRGGGQLVASGRGATERSPAAPPNGVGVELSVATSARLGSGQAGLGLGARSLLDLGRALVGFEGRVDVYQGLGAGAPTGALELVLLGGGRLRSGTLALDLVGGPVLALQGTTKTTKQVGAAGPAITTSQSRVDPRLLLGAHLTFRALSTLRPFVGVDADVGRARAAAAAPSDLTPLPAWTVGVTLGATVGTR